MGARYSLNLMDRLDVDPVIFTIKIAPIPRPARNYQGKLACIIYYSGTFALIIG